MIWEYIKEVSDTAQLPLDKLNALGREGWELVSINRDVFYFKRLVKEVSTDGFTVDVSKRVAHKQNHGKKK